MFGHLSFRWITHLVLALTCLLVPPLAQAQYAVGTTSVTYVDPARGNRDIPCDLYYPALAGGPEQPVADPPTAGFAAVAFGHGFQLPANVYGWIAGELAAQGCVVALPRTGSELFPDHEDFGLDLAFVAAAVRDADTEPASPFFGRMGPRTLVMGHSMGGGCSFLGRRQRPDPYRRGQLRRRRDQPLRHLGLRPS